RTSLTPKSVVIEVRDSGRGVRGDLAPRIFERNVSGKPGGTGLGLALARSIAEAEGGQVVLVRPRPAVFAIFLPRPLPVTGDETPAVSGPAGPRRGRARPPRAGRPGAGPGPRGREGRPPPRR